MNGMCVELKHSAMASHPPPDRAYAHSDPGHLALMRALTFTTGIADAVGYLALNYVFTANMTGNTVILGMALVGGGDLSVIGSLAALAGFMLGAVTSGRFNRGREAGWTDTTTGQFTAVGLIVLALAGVTALFPEPTTGIVGLAVTGALAYAMGMQAGAARHVGVKDVTTVAITSTIAALAADSYLGARTGAHGSRRASAVILMLAGAALGAALLRYGMWTGLLLAGITELAVAFLGHRNRAKAIAGLAARTSDTEDTLR